MLALLIQELPSAPPPGASPGFSFVWYVLILIFLLAAGLISLLVKGRTRVETVNEKRAMALDGLLKTTETERDLAKKELAKAQEDLSEVEAELRVVTGVTVHDLFEFWAKKEAIELEVESLKSQLRATQKTLALWENGEMGEVTSSPKDRRP